MKNTKTEKRQRRRMHIRKTVSGTALKPRIFVFKSNRYFYAGAANDESSNVIMSMVCPGKSEEIVKMAGEFAKKLKSKKIEVGVFDRSGYKYHGLIASFVEELRNKGIKI